MDKPGSQGRANEARALGPRRLDLRVEAGPPVTGWRVHVPDGSVAAEIKPGDKATAEPAGPSGGGQGRSACGPAARGAASVKPGAFQRTESRFDRRVSLHLRGGSPGVGTSKHWLPPEHGRPPPRCLGPWGIPQGLRTPLQAAGASSVAGVGQKSQEGPVPDLSYTPGAAVHPHGSGRLGGRSGLGRLLPVFF